MDAFVIHGQSNYASYNAIAMKAGKLFVPSPAVRGRLLALVALSAMAIFAQPAKAQVLLQENFNFTGALTSNGWTAVSASGTSPINAAAPGLSYPSLPSSGAGNAASILTTGEDDRKLLTSTNSSGSIYSSCLINLSAAQASGDYFYTLSSGTSGYIARVFARSSGSGFQLGLLKASGGVTTPTYDTNVLSFGTTYLIVSKIERFGSSTTDDVASLWVNPPLGASEISATITNSAGNDQVNIDSVVLRQGSSSAAPTLRLGNILVGTTWASVTPNSGGPTVSSFAPASGRVGDTVVITGTGFSGVTDVTFGGVSAVIYTVDSTTQITATVPSGALTGSISVTASTGTGASSAGFTVLAPVITSLSPDAGLAGTAVTIAGTNFSPLTSVTFAGSGGSIAVTPSASSDTSISVTAPAGVVSGPLTVTTPSGSGSSTFRVISPIAVPYGPESFTNGFGQWFTDNVAGTANWNIVTNSFGGGTTNGGTTNSWAQINGFGSDVAANDWLVLGPIDFSTSSNPVATFDTLTRFAYSSGVTNIGELTFKMSTNYSGVGSPATNGSWASLDFAKPATNLVVTPSGFVFVPDAAGRSNVWFAFHYVAGGTISSTTALWQVDNIVFSNSTLTPLGLSLPPAINEGASNIPATVFAAGTNLSAPLDISLSSSDPADLKFKADTNSSSASTLQVTIPAGTNSATFYLDAVKDYTPDTNKTVTVAASTTNTAFQTGSGSLVINNVDYPSTDFTSSGYTQSFSGFTNQSTLPLGWTLVAANQTYTAWGSADTGAKYSAGTTNVFGYQHTSSTGTVLQILTLKNTTGAPITALTISYYGRATRTTETRVPVYTVYVDGQVVQSLGYSTSYGDNFLTRASLQGLDIPNNATFTIAWSSDRGQSAGSSQQIGLSDVNVQLGYTPFPPSLAGVTVYPEYIYDTTAEVASIVTGDGGSAVTESGFVYSLASGTNAPAIGGAGVTQVPWGFPGVGAFGSQLSSLTPSSGYAVRAYAANANGTNYSPTAQFTTAAPNPDFAGLYTQNFNGFSNASAFPAGWKCFSSSNVNSYAGEWLSGSSTGGFYGTTNQPGVLGYQFTTSTGVLQNRLTLKNLTGSTLTNLYISYLGMVTQTQQVRFPSWTVTGDDGSGAVEIAGLGYSTADGTNSTRLAQWTNLSVAPGDSFTVTWSADRGENTNTGSSRRIGVGFVQIATSLGDIVTNAPVVTSSSNLSTSVGETVGYQITASGDATGFWATNLPIGLSVNANSGLISGAVTNTNRTGSAIGLVAYNAYGAGEGSISLTVAKGTPIISVSPTASTLTNGQALSNSILSGGTASVAGAFGWTTPATIPAPGTSSQPITFTPSDSANYNTATGSVSVTVIATGQTFSNWSGGLPVTQPLLVKYAIGGATSPTATNGVPPVTTLSASNLAITAVVRTNDPALATAGYALTNLVTGPWSTNAVSMTPSPDPAPEGCQIQVFSVPRTGQSNQFLRLQTDLTNQ